jgi:hypothetical protein
VSPVLFRVKYVLRAIISINGFYSEKFLTVLEMLYGLGMDSPEEARTLIFYTAVSD